MQAGQHQGAGRGAHGVGGGDVVLDQHRHTVQRATRAAALVAALAVQGLGFGQGMGVELDHRAQLRALAIKRVDAAQVVAGQAFAAELAAGQALLDGLQIQGVKARRGHGGHRQLAGGAGLGQARAQGQGAGDKTAAVEEIGGSVHGVLSESKGEDSRRAGLFQDCATRQERALCRDRPRLRPRACPGRGVAVAS